MKKTIFKRAGLFALSAIMALTMCSAGIFAATGAADSDNTDYVTNRTGNSTALRQANSNNTGTIRLGKILTVNQQNKFPNIEDFVYKITPVSAWDNANVDTAKSGVTITMENMPKPITDTAYNGDHHRITNIQTSGIAPWCSLVSIGNFRDKDGANTSSVTNSNEASNTDKISENKRRTRTTDVTFKFTKAGYYLYRVEEVGSRQNGSVDGLSGLKKDVAGVDYDDNAYYVMFYVCNKQATEDVGANEYGQGTQAGDTIGQEGYLNSVNGDGTQTTQESENGVYVHTITSWTNQYDNAAGGKTATDKKPDNSMRDSQALADATNTLHDLMNIEDNQGQSAKDNTGRVDNNNVGVAGGPVERSNGSNGVAGTSQENQGTSTVTHDNLGKVGISTPEPPEERPDADHPASPNDPGRQFGGPNELEAYRMWNAQVTHDVVLKKNVTGNIGDRTKDFIFTVTLEGLEYNQVYTTDVAAGSTEEPEAGSATNDVTSSRVKMYDMTPAACLASDGKSFTTDSTGKVSFKVKLRDDDILVLNSLPRTASYQIKEDASDHVAQYNIVSTNKTTDLGPIFTETGKTSGGDLGVANTGSNKELSTKVEFVDRYDGTVTIIYQNNRDLATTTGVPGLDYMVYAVVIGLIAAAILTLIRRRRRYDHEEI